MKTEIELKNKNWYINGYAIIAEQTLKYSNADECNRLCDVIKEYERLYVVIDKHDCEVFCDTDFETVLSWCYHN